jgi:hypothetical protein
MKRHMAVAVILALCLGLFCGFSALSRRAQTQGEAPSAEQKITVLSPMGTPPSYQTEDFGPASWNSTSILKSGTKRPCPGVNSRCNSV